MYSRAPRRRRSSQKFFWLLAAGSAAGIAFAPWDVLVKCLLAGCLLAAWLVRTHPLSGDPGVTRRLARGAIYPALAAGAGVWLLYHPGGLATAAVCVLLPPAIVLQLLGRR